MTFACNSFIISNLRVEQGEWVYLHASRALQEDAPTYEKMSMVVPYGDGKACNRIVRVLKGENVERYGGL